MPVRSSIARRSIMATTGGVLADHFNPPNASGGLDITRVHIGDELAAIDKGHDHVHGGRVVDQVTVEGCQAVRLALR